MLLATHEAEYHAWNASAIIVLICIVVLIILEAMNL